jgi:hypothetical protein
MNLYTQRASLAALLLGVACILPASGGTGLQQPAKPEAKKEAPGARDAGSKPVPPEKLREDWHILRGALEEGHSGIYRYTPKAELDRRFDLVDKALDRPMNVYEFYRVVAPAVAGVKCGHTGVRVRPDLSRQKPRLPLEVRVLDGKLFVLRDLSAGPSSLAGQEIRSINGVPADQLVQTMFAATPGDGDVQSSRFFRMGGWSFATNLIELLGLESPYTVILRDGKSGREQTVQINGLEEAKLRAAARTQFPQDERPKEAAKLTFLDDGKIAVLKVNGFGGYVDAARKKDLRKFFPESFTEISKHKSSVLILDLRNNGGGADDLGKLLLSFLIDEPFKYYDDLVVNAVDFSFKKYTSLTREQQARLTGMLERQPNGKYRMVKHPNWGTQQPSKPTFTGKVYILINGGSFSTTSEFLSHVHARKRATFIGAESGGGYYGNTSGPGLLLTLPNTGLQAYVPLMTYYMAVRDYKGAAHGVVPDYPVTYTIDELLGGKDKELALALELARKQ